jgi:acyl-CoA synthetase (AMP-forming)/AMP-acid ligase II
MVPAGPPLIALTYALFRMGAVPVLIDPGMGRAAFLKCVATTAAPTLIGIPKAHVARLIHPGSFRSVRRSLVLGSALGGLLGRSLRVAPDQAPASSREGEPVRAELDLDAPAAVLFTSGSTGPAKGAAYSVRNFFAQRDALRDLYDFQQGEVDVAAFPLFSLFDAAFGMTSVIPDIDPSRPAECRPENIADAIEEHQATTAFGSPALWARVAPWAAARGRSFRTLRRVLMAGAPAPPKLIRAMRPLLAADGDVATPYGATEALPVATIWGREVEALVPRIEAGAGTCVGRPGRHVEVRIIAIDDGPIRDWTQARPLTSGVVGEIVVRGDVVTRAYHNRDDATNLAKIAHTARRDAANEPPRDATDERLADSRRGGPVWHRIGDLGYFDAAGQLWFCGRKAERVVTAKGVIYTDQVECRFSTRPDLPRVALIGLGPTGAQSPVLVIEGEPTDEHIRTARAICGDPALPVVFVARFPVDRRHNAKIHRLDLARAVAKRLRLS